MRSDPVAALSIACCLVVAPQDANAPRHVVTIAGLDAPVCVLHDPEQDVYFVSNINGAGTARDNNGYISRLSPDGAIVTRKFIEGGRDGATLNAPKGLAIVGEDLWVADIDTVRAFNRRTGRPVRTVQPSAPAGLFLNEMTTGPDNAVYVTDTRLEFRGDRARHLLPDRVFRISAAGEATVAVEGNLEGPSGIAWDQAQRRFLIVSLQGSHVFAWRPGQSSATPIWKGIGGYDGIVLDGSSWLVSTLDAAAIYRIEGQQERAIIPGLTTPAAIGFDRKRRQLLIPSFEANTVQIWRIPPAIR